MPSFKQREVLGGVAAGVGIAALVLLGGAAWIEVAPRWSEGPGARLGLAALCLLGPGVSLLAVIGRIGNRRYLNPDQIDGGAPPPGSAAEIDLRVLRNTLEQAALALLVWPAFALTLPADRLGVLPALGAAFPLCRALFWAGYQLSPPLRGAGFAGTFYPTVFAALWTLWTLATG